MGVDPNIKIVVADDFGTMRMMFKQILNKAGFKNLVMAVNGADGLYPVARVLDEIQKYMRDVMEIGRILDLDKFIESSFADKAY